MNKYSIGEKADEPQTVHLWLEHEAGNAGSVLLRAASEGMVGTNALLRIQPNGQIVYMTHVNPCFGFNRGSDGQIGEAPSP